MNRRIGLLLFLGGGDTGESIDTRSHHKRLDAAAVRFYVSPIEDAGTGKCLISTISTAVGGTPQPVQLLPGQRLQTLANILRSYPLSLPPGRYRVQAAYREASGASDGDSVGAVQSEPVSLVIEPLGTPAYRTFLEICARSSVGRVGASQAQGRGFDPRRPLQSLAIKITRLRSSS
jgi:hypothetical protein